MPYKDPNKQREYVREWQRKNRKRKSKVRNSLPSHITKRKMILEAKDKPCAICEQNFPVIAMDLHHVDPSTKEFSVGKGVRLFGCERLQKEIEKCIPLCAVCHRLLHAGLVELVT